MDAAMGATGHKAVMNGASNGPYGIASTRNPRGIDQRAFIDISYETPSGGKNVPMQQQQQPMQPMQQQPMNGYSGYPPGPGQPYMRPGMNGSFQNYPPNPRQQEYQQQQYQPQQYPQQVPPPQRMQYPGQPFPQHQMYNNPNMSGSSAASGSFRAQSLTSRPRRNSNSSVTTTSTVNRFMKKQWGRFGGGGGGGSSVSIKSGKGNRGGYEDDEDGDINDINGSQNEVSFDDIKHLRGDRIGAFGLNDSTPYIPTLTQSVNKGQRMTGDTYRKAQMNQKKMAASNVYKQQQQAQQQAQQMPPRAMSLQGPNPSRLANYQGQPPNGVPLPTNYQPQGYPQGYPQQWYPAQNGSMMNVSRGGAGQYPPAHAGYRGDPRAMSLQTGVNPMQQRNMEYNSYPSVAVSPVVKHVDENEKENVEVNDVLDTVGAPKRNKTITKIDFNNISDDDVNVGKKAVGDDDVVDILEQSSPLKAEVVGDKPDVGVPRSNIESIVTFDSLQDGQKQQKQIYGLNNNSTQQTVFYSASEFPVTKSTGASPQRVPQRVVEENEDPSVTVSGLNETLNKMVLAEDTRDEESTNATVRYSTQTLGSTQPLRLQTEQLSSPIKSNEIVDMGVKLESLTSTPVRQTKAAVVKPAVVNGSESSLSKLNLKKREMTPPLSKSSSSLDTPSSYKARMSYSSDPKTPVSLGLSTPVSGFTPEQCGLLNDNSQLLQELELVTTELASSVSREIKLEGELKQKAKKMVKNSESREDYDVDKTDVVVDDEDTETDLKGLIRGVKFLENGDVEVEEGIEKCTGYAATITTLARELNEERKKRYIIEETLLQQSMDGSMGVDYQNQLVLEKSHVQELNIKLKYLSESETLHKLEKEFLESENRAIKLEMEELKRKYNKVKKQLKLQMS